MAKIKAKKTILVMDDTEYVIGSGDGAYAGLVDGSIEEFVLPEGKTVIKDYLCNNCASLASIDLTGAEDVGASAFMNCTAVNEINVVDAKIKFLGQHAFDKLGSGRDNAENNRLTLDFRKSEFHLIPNFCFGSGQSGMKYTDIYLPATVNQIQANAFSYLNNCNIYFTGYAPQLLSSSIFNNQTNCNIYVPWKDLYNYKNATNWVSLTTIGYAFSSEFEPGETLPTYDKGGYPLTWYSDAAMQNQITVAPASGLIYCSVGSTQAASTVEIINTDCAVLIKDGSNNIYDNDHPIPYGVEVTVTLSPTDGYEVFVCTMNEQALVSGDTWTAASGSTLKIIALYYDGEHAPIHPTFAENSWEIIRAVALAGKAQTYWPVGSEKKAILTNGDEYTMVIYDYLSNRYSRTDGHGGNKMVLGFKECFTSNYQMNSTNTNSGGWPASAMCTTRMSYLYGLLPSDLKSIITQVEIPSASDGSATGSGSLAYASNYLFLPSEYEIFGSRTYSNSIEESQRFGYYATYTSADYRKKCIRGQTSSAYWWERSPYAGSSGIFCLVSSNGDAGNRVASGSSGVAPCFCI